MSLRAAVVILGLALHGAVAAAGPASFTPPSRVHDAQMRFKRGTALFDARDFAGAAAEYAAAFELDPGAKWLLLDVAIARRKANACPEAIDAYNAFLAAGPPDEQANKARDGEAECAEALAQARREDEAARAATAAKQAQEARDRDDAAARVAAAAQHQRALDEQAARDREAAAIGEQRAHTRHRVILFGSTAAGLGLVAGGLYLFARHEASDATPTGSLAAFESHRSDALALQTASEITVGVAVAMAATTAVYYALNRGEPAHALAVAPTPAGAMLVLTGAL